MPKLRSLALGAFTACAATAANAEIRYDFTAISAEPVNGYPQWGEVTGSFTYYSPTFLVPTASTPIAVQASDLASCAATSSLEGSFPCGSQAFQYDPGSPPEGPYDVVFFGFLPPEPTFPYLFYYFDPSAFTTLGDHYTVVFGADQEGELVVSGTLPELSTWVLTFVGFAGLAAAGRWARRARLGLAGLGLAASGQGV